MKGAKLLIGIVLAVVAAGCARPPAAYGPVPTPGQLRWQESEMNMFCHFGPNTFTGKEWGDGDESEALFNPTQMDCRQWARVARQTGFSSIVVTAKHHDGFCLWPSKYSSHTVAHSPWKAGEGDVLKELAAACAGEGIGMGVYLSPWDRNAPSYGTPEYNEVFAGMLGEVLSGYGEISEQWFDGANGEGPNGKRQKYDWKLFNTTVAKLQPDAVIFSDVGPGCRWVGNESGVAPDSCWATLNTKGFEPGKAPSTDVLGHGNRKGKDWIPAEVDVSIRNSWFWQPGEHPKTLAELLRIYYTSVGRNAVLLLNVPPDRRGLIDPEDSLRLVEFRTALDSIFSHNMADGARFETSSDYNHLYRAQNLALAFDGFWAAGKADPEPVINVELPEGRTFNRIVLQEAIAYGQRVENFEIEYLAPDGSWKALTSGSTIGHKRILQIPMVTTSGLRITFHRSLAPPVIKSVALYRDNYQMDGEQPSVK